MTKLTDFSPRAAGIPWFRKEDYSAAVAIMEDGAQAPATWEIFNERSEDAERGLKQQGHIVVRAYIDPETFPGWCVANGHRVNSEGRAAFAASIAAEQHGRDNG